MAALFVSAYEEKPSISSTAIPASSQAAMIASQHSTSALLSPDCPRL